MMSKKTERMIFPKELLVSEKMTLIKNVIFIDSLKLHCKVIMHVKKSKSYAAMSTENRNNDKEDKHHLESHLKLGYPGPTVRLGNYSSVNSLRSLKIS